MDLKLALNAISDVVQNRPPPIREFDQIYMKVGDMVVQAEFIARLYDGKDLLFVGDGDAISLCVAHLKAQGVIDYGPKSIELIDFDERIVNAFNRFASHYGISDCNKARLYNVADALPEDLLCSKHGFYTNPPWGASNEGTSINAFARRGFEALLPEGKGVIVMADDEELCWTKEVLYEVQAHALQHGFIVSEMIPEVHCYHLDDAPDLKSCSLVLQDVKKQEIRSSGPLLSEDRDNFYGKGLPLVYQYVRDLTGIAPDTANPATYKVERYCDVSV